MITLRPGHIEIEAWRKLYASPQEVQLDERCWSGVEDSQQAVERLLASGKTFYGLNTGFGMLASTRISAEDLAQLQLNLVRSHCAGVGPPLDKDVVRLVLILKATSLARGYSGVRRELIELLLALYNADLLPLIPSQGSVGASGDLAPLAHLSAALIGEGTLTTPDGPLPAAEALAAHGLQPLTLQPKEGIALLNGTQVSTALALAGLFELEQTFAAALVAGAMSVDATMGSDAPFDPRILDVRNHPAQTACARHIRDLLVGSEIRASHLECDRVQDPYSLRCQPQVMGAAREAMERAAETLTRESNAVSDNPLVFAEDDAILSGGNFHAEVVGFVADHLAVAIAEVGALCERRIALLIDQHLSHLPPFLVESSGLNSGFMIPQVTAVALVCENKHLATPVCTESLPTSANQEDHVSMATYAARRLLTMNENLAHVVAIELLAAGQGIELRRPLRSSEPLEECLAAIRAEVPKLEGDRAFSADISAVRELVRSYAWPVTP